MNFTRQEVISAISHFVILFGKSEIYKHLLEDEVLLKVVQKIVFEMFVRGFNYHECSLDTFKQYKVLLDYSKEYSKNEFVVLNEF